MGAVKTLHIVGYKNSGKTTLMNRWIRLLTEKGYRVFAIKHHAHDTPLAMPDERKDSFTYLQHGAYASVVAGAKLTQQIIVEELSFQQLQKVAHLHEPDMILIEGYKYEKGDKVVFSRDLREWESLKRIDGIKLVIGVADTYAVPVISS